MRTSTEMKELIRNAYLSNNPHLLNGIILTTIIICLYLKVTHHEFLINWDDVDYILANQDIQGFTLYNLKSIFTKYSVGNYAPLHLLSYMIDYSIWGLNPAAFKMTNVMLHTGCTLIFYRLLVRLGLTMPQAFLASVFFAVHPVQVESVAWAAQRKNPLSLLFFLTSWYLWDVWKSGEPQKKLWYLCSLAFFVLAVLSKSIAVILPLFLLAQELFLEKQSITWKMIASKLPYIILSGACFLAALASQKTEGGGLVAYHGGSLAITMMNMLPVFSRYLTLLLFPTGLTIIYNAALKTTPDLAIICSCIIVVLFIIGWLRLRKPHPAHFFWLSLFILGILPVSNIIPLTTMMNDRYLYYPMLGFAPFAVLVLNGVIDRFKMPFFPVPAIIVMVSVTLLSIASWNRIDVWKNSIALWSDAMSKADAGTWYESSSHTNYLIEGYTESVIVQATTLSKKGNRAEAQKYCLLALTYDPNNFNALGLLSNLYLEENRPMQARPHLIKLVTLYSKSDIAHVALGLSYKMTDEINNAEEQMRIALAINPQNERANSNLMEILRTKNVSPH